MLNKAKGNMYNHVTHTWNTIKGECAHGCSYCYMKRFGKQNPMRFDEKELKTDLGSGNIIFVGSSCDMWARSVDDDYIHRTLQHCRKHKENKYIFQSKNPKRFYDFVWQLPNNSIFGTTIETDLDYHYDCFSSVASIYERANAIEKIGRIGYETFITIEPIMEFGRNFANIIKSAKPTNVYIGADSGNNKLPEPTKDETLGLIIKLSRFTNVTLNPNINRIMK